MAKSGYGRLGAALRGPRAPRRPLLRMGGDLEVELGVPRLRPKRPEPLCHPNLAGFRGVFDEAEEKSAVTQRELEGWKEEVASLRADMQKMMALITKSLDTGGEEKGEEENAVKEMEEDSGEMTTNLSSATSTPKAPAPSDTTTTTDRNTPTDRHF